MPIRTPEALPGRRRVRRLRRVVLTAATALVATLVVDLPEAAKAATTRSTVTFTVNGSRVVGHHYRAAGTARPVVVMGHGFGLLQSTGLQPFAERFAAAGFDALTFDYRYFGESGGTPRELLDVPSQIDDFAGAVAAAKRLPGVDPAKVVVWGSSLGGGHALQTAAHTPGIAAVIAQVPQVSGLSTLSGIPAHNLPWLGLAAAEDMETVAAGTKPRYIPIAAEPGGFAALSQPGALEGFRRLTAGTSWNNRETGRTVSQIPFYSPETNAARITAPTLIVTASQDNIHPPQAARDLAARRNWSHHEVPGTHWDVFAGGPGFGANVAAQLQFLRKRF